MKLVVLEFSTYLDILIFGYFDKNGLSEAMLMRTAGGLELPHRLSVSKFDWYSSACILQQMTLSLNSTLQHSTCFLTAFLLYPIYNSGIGMSRARF